MEYKVKFTEQCLEEIEDICEYMNRQYKTDNPSKQLRRQVMKKIKNLSTIPQMYIKINKYDRLKREYRRIVINNYILLYTIDESKKIVYVSHMYYGEQNYFQGLI